MLSCKTITRRKLQTLGLTLHQARSVTQLVDPMYIVSGTHVYSLNEVISAIRSRLQSPGLKLASQTAFSAVLPMLLEELDNVIVAPFGLSREEQIGFYVRRILNFPGR